MFIAFREYLGMSTGFFCSFTLSKVTKNIAVEILPKNFASLQPEAGTKVFHIL